MSSFQADGCRRDFQCRVTLLTIRKWSGGFGLLPCCLGMPVMEPGLSMRKTPQVKKTRRGKRAGRNLKERASFESHRASMDSRRSSLDERGSLDLPQPRFSTDSQRPSLDGHQVHLPSIQGHEQACSVGSSRGSVSSARWLHD